MRTIEWHQIWIFFSNIKWRRSRTLRSIVVQQTSVWVDCFVHFGWCFVKAVHMVTLWNHRDIWVGLHWKCICVKSNSSFKKKLWISKIKNVLHYVWAFSIAMDGWTKVMVPYLVVQLWFVVQGKLFNVHFIALPMHESHTGKNTILIIRKFLDAICDNWKKKMISVSTNGA